MNDDFNPQDLENTEDLFTPDFSEAGGGLAPEGTYTLRLFGAPHACISKKGTAYLTWRLDFLGEDKKYGAIFNRTMIKGRGAGQLRNILVALGLSNEEAKNIRIRPRGEITDPKKGTPADLYVNGEIWDPAGTEITAIITIDKADPATSYSDQNRISKYLKK